MIEDFDSSLLPVTHNTKLQDKEGLIKQITNQEYQRVLSKARTLNPITQLLDRTQTHSEFGITQFVLALLRLFGGLNGSRTNIKVKKSQQQKSNTFQQMTLEQQDIMFVLEKVISLEYNSQILIRYIKMASFETNLLFILLLSLYKVYIVTNENCSRVIEWFGMVYDSNFLKVCLDQRIKQTLTVAVDILENQIDSQKQELEVLGMIEEITQNVGHYQELREGAQIETIYMGF